MGAINPLNIRPSGSVTSHIIFNLAQLGIPIRDSEFFDIGTYLEIIELQNSIMKGNDEPRRATQADIDAFLM